MPISPPALIGKNLIMLLYLLSRVKDCIEVIWRPLGIGKNLFYYNTKVAGLGEIVTLLGYVGGT